LNSFDNTSSIDEEEEFGFSRSEFKQSVVVGSVKYYERHVFLCYKKPSVWPPRIQAAEFDRLPRLLSAALTARKSHIKRQVCWFLGLLVGLDFVAQLAVAVCFIKAFGNIGVAVVIKRRVNLLSRSWVFVFWVLGVLVFVSVLS
jgi:hypothetical protein